ALKVEQTGLSTQTQIFRLERLLDLDHELAVPRLRRVAERRARRGVIGIRETASRARAALDHDVVPVAAQRCNAVRGQADAVLVVLRLSRYANSHARGCV